MRVAASDVMHRDAWQRGMPRNAALAALACLGAVLAGCVAPQEATRPHDDEPHGVLTPDAVTWGDAPDSLPAGAQMAILQGDPAKEGLFTIRFAVPAGYQVPPHTHPKREHVTLLSGNAYLGMGTRVDTTTATPLATGSFFHLPAGMEHYFVAGDEPVVLQLHGEGPWGITYVDPADDPRNAIGP